MKLFLRLVFRQVRNSPRFFLGFTTTLSLGLLGLSLIVIFGAGIERHIQSHAQNLIGGDLVVEKNRLLTPQQERSIHETMATYWQEKTESISTLSMVYFKGDKKKQSRLVRLYGIESNFPLYGELLLDDGSSANAAALLEEREVVWIGEDFARQYQLKKQDLLFISGKPFTIKGIITHDPTTALSMQALAPKVYLGIQHLVDSPLLSFGATAKYYLHFSLSNTAQSEELSKQLLKKLDDPAIKVLTLKNSGAQVGRLLELVNDYLGLACLIALFLACVGLGYLLLVYILEKRKQIGILKSLGLRARFINIFFLVQVLLPTVAANIIVALIMHTLLIPIELLLNNLLSLDIKLYFDLAMSSLILLFSIVLVTLVALPFIMEISSKKITDLLEYNQLSLRPVRIFLSFIPLFVFFYFICVLMAKSYTIGTLFYALLLLSSAGIFFIILAGLKGGQKLITNVNLRLIPWGLSWRYLTRNALESSMAIMAIGVGILLLVVQLSLEDSILAEFSLDHTSKPGLFLFDLQAEQLDSFEVFLNKHQVKALDVGPMVRARLIKHNAKKYSRLEEDGFVTREHQQRMRMRNRGVNLSYKKNLNESESLVRGEWWEDSLKVEEMQVYPLSVERRYAKRMDLSLGDTLEFDVLGVPIKTQISNIRRVRWSSFLPNFFLVLPPGVLEQAPQMYVVALEKMTAAKLDGLTLAMAQQFPNVSQIKVEELVDNLSGIFRSFAWSVKLMAAFTSLVGCFVLLSIFKHKLQSRDIDMALFATIGMEHQNIKKIFCREFYFCILLTLFLANLIGSIIAYFLTQWVLEIVFIYSFWSMMLLNLGVIFIAGIVWWAIANSIMGYPPQKLLAGK